MRKFNEVDHEKVTLRVPKVWQLRKVAGANGYMTLAEFLRFITKKAVDEYRKIRF
ncbi:hypothetical protein HYV43_01850 [Candidatus Micrarchaeota archaeon]|nr:hypothetical protein [Candidatus Micrarchaeota archaeon]